MGELMRATCPDCGAPVKDDMLPAEHGCWFWGQAEAAMRRDGRSEADIQAFLHCGGDPLCEGNAYNKREADRVSWSIFHLFAVAAVTICIVAAVAYASL